MESATLLFVYGTLLRGQPNHSLLHGCRRVGDARTAARFELVVFDRYPALVREGTTSVTGELYAVDSATLAALDRFEGHPSLYRRDRLELEDGTFAEAYFLEARRARGDRRIAGGDWRSWCKGAACALLSLTLAGSAYAERHRDAGSDAARGAAATQPSS